QPRRVAGEVATGEPRDRLDEAELHLVGFGQHREDRQARRLVDQTVEVQEPAQGSLLLRCVAHRGPATDRRASSSRRRRRNSRCCFAPTTMSATAARGACGCCQSEYDIPTSMRAAWHTRNTPTMNSSGVFMKNQTST